MLWKRKLIIIPAGSNRLEEIKVLSLQFDPASFDSQVVNKFTNSTIKVTILFLKITWKLMKKKTCYEGQMFICYNRTKMF